MGKEPSLKRKFDGLMYELTTASPYKSKRRAEVDAVRLRRISRVRVVACGDGYCLYVRWGR